MPLLRKQRITKYVNFFARLMKYLSARLPEHFSQNHVFDPPISHESYELFSGHTATVTVFLIKRLVAIPKRKPETAARFCYNYADQSIAASFSCTTITMRTSLVTLIALCGVSTYHHTIVKV